MQQFVPIHHGDLAAAAGLPPEDVQRRLDACVVLHNHAEALCDLCQSAFEPEVPEAQRCFQ